MSFIYPALLAGLALAALPILIHLINMMRHKRVKWAAMDFLLASHKKHRNWVWLKQLMLLLMRIAAVLLVVLMLAGIGCQKEIAGWLGGKTTHHYVLLDDSLSTSDRSGGERVFDRGQVAVSKIASRAELLNGEQLFTLLRYSKALGGGNPEDPEATSQTADLNGEQVAENFDIILQEKFRGMETTELAVGPQDGLAVIRQLIAQSPDENAIVYLVSDFRKQNWENPTETRTALEEMKEAGARIELVNCVKYERPNLAITEIQPEKETRAAGVPLFVYVTVKNFGKDPATKVPLDLRTLTYNDEEIDQGRVDLAAPEIDEVPRMQIDAIPPGESVTRRVQVYFPKAGKHVVEASLPDDFIAADNTRRCVIETLPGEPILIVDGHPQERNAYYLTSIINNRITTGALPEVQPMSYLRDADPATLAKFHAIYLLDVDRFDDAAVTHLEQYVRAGGGLAIYFGPHALLPGYTEKLYKEGAGLLPLPVERVDVLPEVIGEPVPDIEPTDHPLFKFFLAQKNSELHDVKVLSYVRPPPAWKPIADSTVQVIARLRNQQPLFVEQQFGKGRVVACLTSIEPTWVTWTANTVHGVLALKLKSYLASPRREDPERIVGSPIDVQLDVEKFRQDISFVAPGEKNSTRFVVDKSAEKKEDSPLMSASLGRGAAGKPNGETNQSGVYDVWAAKTGGGLDVSRYALNVDVVESDLSLLPPRDLVAELETAKPQYSEWDSFVVNPERDSGSNWSRWILFLMIGLLLGEQLLAYSASYHTGGSRR